MATTRILAAAALAAALLASSCGKPAPPPDPAGLVAVESAIRDGLPAEARRRLHALDLRLLVTRDQRLRTARAALRAHDPATGARALAPDAKGDAALQEEPRLLRAECLFRSGDFGAAQKEFADLEAAGKKGERWKVLFALFTFAKGEVDNARRDVGALVKAGCRDPDALVLEAEIARIDGLPGHEKLRAALATSTDRIPIARAMGKSLLAERREPGAAAAFLEEAVRERPWDRDARLDLARARVVCGGEKNLSLAAEDARKLVADDPDDLDARIVLADGQGAAGLEAMERAGGSAAAGEAAFREAAAAYEEVLRRGVTGTPMAIVVLQAYARTHIERILLDPPQTAAAPGSHYARAVEALEKAAALDPDGRFRGPWDLALKAETCYLRGRACRLTHSGSKDHAEAQGWFEEALKADGRHLEAQWDLAMICYDFLRTPQHIMRAFNLVEEHVKERVRRGLPPLTGQRKKILFHIRKLAAEGKGFEAGTLTPEAPPEDGEKR